METIQAPPRRRIASILIVLLSAVLTLVFMEFAVRLALPDYDPSGRIRFIAETATRPLMGPPNTTERQIKNTGDFNISVHFNKYGLRDDKDLKQSKKGDLFLVGDSFAFGWGVETRDRVSEIIEGLSGRPVFNLSSGGGDFDNYQLLLDYAARMGAARGPAIVLINMETDLSNYAGRRQLEATAKTAPAKPRETSFGDDFLAFKSRLMENSALYFMATSIVHTNALLNEIAVKAGLIRPNLKAIKGGDIDSRAIRSSAKRMRDLLDKYPGFAVLVPSRANWTGTGREKVRRIHMEFSRELKKQGVRVLDLLDVFSATDKPLAYYFKNDAHWNPRGHRLAAEAIAAYIKAAAK